MIVSRTPLRISFFSGGSDLPSFYEKEFGAALSTTIDKFIFVSVRNTPHQGVRVMYDTVEDVSNVEEMQHSITRESLKQFDITKELTISSVSDILSRGSGLGSSSAFTAGLINSLYYLKNNVSLNKRELAEYACDIEMNKCMFPVGKQDQYAAAYGGFNLFKFLPDGTVEVDPLNIKQETKNKLQQHLLLVYSGRGRSANQILQKQKEAMLDENKFNIVKNGRNKAFKARDYLINGDVESFGALLHEACMDKKSVVKEITQDYFDVIYNKAIEAGSIGGKLLGAGGGGFFIFFTPPEKRSQVIYSITNSTDCKVYNYNFTNLGSTIVLN
jgi:D-glycero-alpha-D-manno-heptose-7-phosphate kinase